MCQKPHPRSQLRSVSGLRTKANLLNTTASDLLFYKDFSLKYLYLCFTVWSELKWGTPFTYQQGSPSLSPDQSVQAFKRTKIALLTKVKSSYFAQKISNEKSVPIIIQVKVVIAKVTLLCGEVDLITQQTQFV